MTNFSRDKVLATRRQELQNAVAWLCAYQPPPTRSLQELPAGVCYDNRHPKNYYAKIEQAVLELGRRRRLNQTERELIIDQALSSVYYKDFYPEFAERFLVPFGREKFQLWNHCQQAEQTMNLSLLYYKIKPDLPRAQKYLIGALTVLARGRGIDAGEKIVLTGRCYDYLSMLAEHQGMLKQAVVYLTQALRQNEQHPEYFYTYQRSCDQGLIKYQYIKRALLQRQLNAPAAALNDLAQALTHRGGVYPPTKILAFDEVIYWERAKTLAHQQNYAAAQKALTTAINLCQLNYDRRPGQRAAPAKELLLEHLNNYRAVLAKKSRPAPALSAAHSSEARPEARRNYDTFQVNPKCTEYLAFIAKVHAKPSKTARDWEYLAAYEFSRFANCRPYEEKIAPVLPGDDADKINWWIPGLRHLYLTRDYHRAAQFFDKYLATTPDLLGYELTAKAKMALGEYAAAVKDLTRGLAQLKKVPRTPENEKTLPGQGVIFHLLRGIAYRQLGEPDRAGKEFTAGLSEGWVQSDIYGKITEQLRWERARLALSTGHSAAAQADIQRIKYNRAAKKYLTMVDQK